MASDDGARLPDVADGGVAGHDVAGDDVGDRVAGDSGSDGVAGDSGEDMPAPARRRRNRRPRPPSLFIVLLVVGGSALLPSWRPPNVVVQSAPAGIPARALIGVVVSTWSLSRADAGLDEEARVPSRKFEHARGDGI